MVEVPASSTRPGAGQGGPALGALLAATALLMASTSIVFPLLAQLQDAYGLPTWSLGVISGAAFLAGLGAQLLLAPLADRGHARLLLLGGLAGAAFSAVLFGTGSELIQLTAARVIAGVAIGAFVPAARAIVSAAEPEAAGRNLGRLAAAELGGFVVGPIAGAALFELFGLRVPFFVFGGLALVGALVIVRRPLPELRATGAGSSRPSLSLLRYRQVVVAALLAVALFLPVGVYDSLWARYLEDRGAGPVFVGATLALYGLPFVLLASRGGRFADRFGPVRSAFTCLVVIAPLTLFYGSVASLGLIVAVSLVESVAQAVAVPATQSAMARAVPAGSAAAGQGLAGAMQQLAAGVVALLAAPVYGAAGSVAVFGGAAAVIALIGCIAWVVNRHGSDAVPATAVAPTAAAAPD